MSNPNQSLQVPSLNSNNIVQLYRRSSTLEGPQIFRKMKVRLTNHNITLKVLTESSQTEEAVPEPKPHVKYTDAELSELLKTVDYQQLNMDDEQAIQMAITILNKSSFKRTSHELDFVVHLLSKIQFFQSLTQEIPETQVILNLFRQMQYEPFKKNEVVTRIGEYGRKFYVILEGELVVMVKKNIDDIENDQINKHQRELEEIEKKNKPVTQKRSSQHQSEDALFYEELKLTYPDLKIIHHLQKGQSFGEIALKTDGKRVATIVCKTETKLAVVNKTSYNEVVDQYEEKLTREKVDFFKRVSAFAKLPSNQLLQLTYAMEKTQYLKGNKISDKQGCQERKIYIIKKGDAVLYQQIDRQNEMGGGGGSSAILNNNNNGSTTNIGNTTTSNINKLYRLNLKEQILDKQKNKQWIELAVLGEGQYFGDFWVFNKKEKNKDPVAFENRKKYKITFLNDAEVYSLEYEKLLDLLSLSVSALKDFKAMLQQRQENYMTLIQNKQKISRETIDLKALPHSNNNNQNNYSHSKNGTINLHMKKNMKEFIKKNKNFRSSLIYNDSNMVMIKDEQQHNHHHNRSGSPLDNSKTSRSINHLVNYSSPQVANSPKNYYIASGNNNNNNNNNTNLKPRFSGDFSGQMANDSVIKDNNNQNNFKYQRVVNEYTEGEFLRNQIKKQSNIRLKNFFKDFNHNLKRIAGNDQLIDMNYIKQFADEYQLESPDKNVNKVSKIRSEASSIVVRKYQDYLNRISSTMDINLSSMKSKGPITTFTNNNSAKFTIDLPKASLPQVRNNTVQVEDAIIEGQGTDRLPLINIKATPKSVSLSLPKSFIKKYKNSRMERQLLEHQSPKRKLQILTPR